MGLALLIVLFVEHRAAADGGGEAAESTRQAGIHKFEEGLKAIAAGDHRTALAAFDASNSLLPSPNSELYIARCYLALGKIASAHALFLLAANHAEERLGGSGERRYVATHDTALREAEAIERDVPKLAILLPPDAGAVVVKKNGAVVGASRSSVATDPGPIVIDITGPRLVPFHAELDLARGESRRVEVKLERVPTAIVDVKLPEPRPAGLVVSVAGEPLESPTPRAVDPGMCVVDATAPGYRAFHREHACADGETVSIGVALETAEIRVLTPPSSPEHGTSGPPPFLRPFAYALGGAGIVAMGVGAYFGVRARLTDDDADRECPTLTTCTDRGVALGRDAHDQARVSTIAVAAGAGLLAGGVVTYLLAPKRGGVTVAPTAGPSAAGIQAMGTW